MTESSMFDAAAREKEVTLTTYGRKTGKPRKVTVWVITDGRRLFVRSGQGLKRHWPQNLIGRGEAKIQIGARPVEVKARHITDPAEAREVSGLARQKYGPQVKTSKGAEPLTQAEQATFELIPA